MDQAFPVREYRDSQKAFKILYSRDEPHVMATIRFNDEVAQRGTLLYISGNIADNRDPAAVGDEFLKECAANARPEPEEIFVEPLGGDHNYVGAMRLGDQVRGVPFSPQFLAVGWARKVGWRIHC